MATHGGASRLRLGSDLGWEICHEGKKMERCGKWLIRLWLVVARSAYPFNGLFLIMYIIINIQIKFGIK